MSSCLQVHISTMSGVEGLKKLGVFNLGKGRLRSVGARPPASEGLAHRAGMAVGGPMGGGYQETGSSLKAVQICLGDPRMSQSAPGESGAPLPWECGQRSSGRRRGAYQGPLGSLLWGKTKGFEVLPR